MGSSQQLFPPTGSQSSSTSTSGYSLSIPSSNFASTSSSQSQDTSNSTTLANPNSPETFKQNVQIALEHVARVNSLARGTLHGIQNAYQAGNDPAQTKANLAALNQATGALADFLRQTGVGAHPLPPSDLQSVPPGLPSEQQLIADTAHGVQQLYEQLKRTQESSAIVASLLGAGEARSKT
ncbi:hypothetical protein PAXRUDRAFT_408694 [Paxillus rubicundulus Ve08.2h10]|uniref:Uncharacterized protein n=1 Tax=Paxillus rubicundulus Ve08.2h10 TaxID=930991 RepID=A0A0D0C0R3_9AGAM|nr:hypothetical protein PAXRUDRAFT_408694 [Paxillus rubicundulus Ve08.2h10]